MITARKIHSLNLNWQRPFRICLTREEQEVNNDWQWEVEEARAEYESVEIASCFKDQNF